MFKLILWRCIFWGAVVALIYGMARCVGDHNDGGVTLCALGLLCAGVMICTAPPGELF